MIAGHIGHYLECPKGLAFGPFIYEHLAMSIVIANNYYVHNFPICVKNIIEYNLCKIP